MYSVKVVGYNCYMQMTDPILLFTYIDCQGNKDLHVRSWEFQFTKK